MRRVRASHGSIVFLLLVIVAPALAQERPFCTWNTCTSDRFLMRFGDGEDAPSVTAARMGDEIEVTFLVKAISEGIQGWSFGVRHDPDKLEAVEIITLVEGVPTIFFDRVGISPWSRSPGIVAAVVLAIFPPPGSTLPAGETIPVARARYRVIAALDPHEATELRFDNDLYFRGCAPISTNFTIKSQSRPPEVVEEARIFGRPEQQLSVLGDANGDGRLDISDAVTVVMNVMLGQGRLFDCDAMLDINEDAQLDISDPIALLVGLFYPDSRIALTPNRCEIRLGTPLSCRESNCTSANARDALQDA